MDKGNTSTRLLIAGFSLFFILMVALVVIVFTGTGPFLMDSDIKKAFLSSEVESKIILRFMNWDSSNKATRERLETVFKEFENKHPHIRVVNISVPFYEYQKHLVMQTSDGNDPDIIQLTSYWSSLLGSKGVLYPLEDYVEKERNMEFISQEALETCKYDSRLYSVPFSVNPYALWYNKNILKSAGIDQPPSTMEELTRQLETIKKEYPYKYGIGLDLTKTNYALTNLWPLFYSFGASDIMQDMKRPGFSSKEAVQTLRWIKMAVKNKYTPEGVKTDLLREKMSKDEIVFKIDGPELRGTIQTENKSAEYEGELFDRAFGVIPMPTVSGNRNITSVNTHSLGISSRSDHKREAWEFVKFMLKEESSNKDYVIPSGYIPALHYSVDNCAIELNNSSSQVFLTDIIPFSKSVKYTPKYYEYGMIVIDGIQKILAGADVLSVCEEIDALIKEVYNE